MRYLFIIKPVPSQDTLVALNDFESILVLRRQPYEEISLLVADAAIASHDALDFRELDLVDECAAVAVSTISVQVSHAGSRSLYERPYKKCWTLVELQVSITVALAGFKYYVRVHG